jgi:hypothetical protein
MFPRPQEKEQEQQSKTLTLWVSGYQLIFDYFDFCSIFLYLGIVQDTLHKILGYDSNRCGPGDTEHPSGTCCKWCKS